MTLLSKNGQRHKKLSIKPKGPTGALQFRRCYPSSPLKFCSYQSTIEYNVAHRTVLIIFLHILQTIIMFGQVRVEM